LATVTTDRRATLLLLDGARADVFAHLVDAGDLPNISRHLLESGCIAPATTVFPSTTGVAYLPFVTGCYPGTCDVPGIRWVDVRGYAGDWRGDRQHLRSYCGPQGGLINHDLRPDIATLFDLVPESVALCSPFNRGLTPERDRVQRARTLWGALAHYVGNYGPLERAVGRALCRTARERHRFVFAVFPGVDGVTHFWDPWHTRVLDMYRGFDRIVGEYAAAGGFEGDHLTLLVSDHGLTQVDHHTDVSLELEAIGLPVLRYPGIWRRNPRVAVMVSGNGSVQVYLRPGVPRERRLTIGEIESGAVDGIPRNLVRHLAHLPGVAMVVGQEDGEVQLVTARGRARLVETGGGRIAYRPDTADVLQLGEPVERGGRDWLEHTLDSPYPDAPVQLTQLFRSPRTGDLAVIAGVGWDLRRDWEIPEHRSGHGSLTADHMRCLVASSRCLAGPLRTVDTFPLILDHLGVDLPHGIDGVLPGRPLEPAIEQPALVVGA
jgi:hypothetical protein